MKKKIGSILYFLSIAVVVFVGLLFLVKKELVSEKLLFLVGSGALFASVTSSLLTGDTGIRGIIVERAKQPGLFWFLLVFYCLLGAAFFITAFFQKG